MWALLALACGDPGEVDQQVGYRDGADGGSTSGERGNVVISEVLWSGSVNADGVWDPADVFVELRNQGTRPVNVKGWQIQQDGTLVETYVIPTDLWIEVGAHAFITAKTDGCFPEPDAVIPALRFPGGDPFRLTLRDVDERLIEGAGDREMPPFAGGYDLVRSRSMERVELMFGGRGTEPGSWHYYTTAGLDGNGTLEIEPNYVNVLEGCRSHTLASPGWPNSPDYSGAYSTGSFE